MKTALLLEKLEGQLATLRQRCAPVAQFATLSARFDRHLFQTRATTLQACLDEAGDNLAALRHAVEQQQLPQVAWLAEHLATQLEASRVKPPPGHCASGTVRHRKLPAGSVNVFSIRILSGGYVRWLPNVEPVWRERPISWNSRRCIVKWKPMKRAWHAAAMRWIKSKTG